VLTAALSALTADDSRAVAAAAVDRTSAAPQVACVNGDPDRVFEIGSITKALTGMLLADSISRGEVTLETCVRDLLPQFAGKVLGSVTMRELCTHTSGLPRLPRSPAFLGRAVLGQLIGTDPYRNPSASRVLEAAGRQVLRSRGKFRYSNLGAAVLGQALAAAAATTGTGQEPAADYATLLTDRILTPLGMTRSRVAVTGDSADPGWSARGRDQQPWLLGGYAPAGGVITTIGDMARLAARLVDGSAPGSAALDPVDPEPSPPRVRRSGMFWVVDPGPGVGETVTWHNGMTGGYSAMIRIRRRAGTAVVVLAAVADGARVSRIALDLEESVFGGR
jgi:CubicO group peptidase (beta-lactamase class C family)